MRDFLLTLPQICLCNNVNKILLAARFCICNWKLIDPRKKCLSVSNLDTTVPTQNYAKIHVWARSLPFGISCSACPELEYLEATPWFHRNLLAEPLSGCSRALFTDSLFYLCALMRVNELSHPWWTGPAISPCEAVTILHRCYRTSCFFSQQKSAWISLWKCHFCFTPLSIMSVYHPNINLCKLISETSRQVR